MTGNNLPEGKAPEGKGLACPWCERPEGFTLFLRHPSPWNSQRMHEKRNRRQMTRFLKQAIQKLESVQAAEAVIHCHRCGKRKSSQDSKKEVIEILRSALKQAEACGARERIQNVDKSGTA